MAGSGPARPPARWVIDTSVVVKWFNPEEEDHQLARAVRALHTSGVTMGVVPELAIYELANALRHNPGSDLAAVTAALAEVRALDLMVVPLQVSMLVRAAELSFDTRASVYDCYFAALAEALHAALVTADNKMLRRLRGYEWVIPLREAARA